MPTLIYDIMRVMFALTGPAAFVCLVNAGIALRKEGGTVFLIGGGLSRWMLGSGLVLASGTGPLPSLLSAMFLLAISSTHALIDSWTPVGNRFSLVLGLESMWNYLASRIFPLAAGLAICGAVIQFAFNRPGYLRLVACAGGFLTVSALWLLINRMMT